MYVPCPTPCNPPFLSYLASEVPHCPTSSIHMMRIYLKHQFMRITSKKLVECSFRQYIALNHPSILHSSSHI
jgi:hypothetical protein